MTACIGYHASHEQHRPSTLLRYHPAVIAQASATLAEMHPDRFWVALGSGQALNEHDR